MKRNIFLSFAIAFTLIVSSVFAEEIIAPINEEVLTEQDSNSIEEPTTDIESPEENDQKETSPTEEISQEEYAPQVSSLEIISDDEKEIVEEEFVFATTTDLLADLPASSTSPVATSTVNLFIRNGVDIVFDQLVEISESEEVEVIDVEGVSRKVPSNSVLGVLANADKKSEDFRISKLVYYDGVGFYLECIEIKDKDVCPPEYDYDTGWKYAVNQIYGKKAIDLMMIENNYRVGLMFGKTYQIVFDEDKNIVNKPFNAYTQIYNYENNTWEPHTGEILGLLTNPWDISTLIATSSVDSEGKTSFSVETPGLYSVGIYRNDPDWGDYYDSINSIFVATTTSTSTDTSTGGSTGGGSNKKEFKFDKALKFIGEDNSYGGFGLNGWVTIAFSAYGENDSNLRNYVKNITKLSSSLLDNERQAMAILALGENPYNYKGINFIEEILKKFNVNDDGQFGELNEINDDIFALIVLSKVGYTTDDIEIKKTIDFLKTKQNKNNGLWGNEDLTGAAIQALSPFVGKNDSAILNAKKQLQKNSWSESISTTSWVSMAMYDLGENWIKNGKTAEDYFSDLKQQEDGSLTEEGNDILTTSYAIPAIIGKSWNDILEPVSRPKDSVITSGGSSDNSTSTATTTDTSIATSTDPVATSTQEFVLEDIPETATTSIITSVQFVNKNLEDNQDLEDQEESELSSATSSSLAQNQIDITNQKPWFKSWLVYIASGLFAFIVGFKFILKFK